jgi:short-subunit dehydrogenase
MNPFMKKYGPWAVVTGASSGIGCALARQLARHGMNMVLVGRSVDALNRLATELHVAHAKCECRILALDLNESNSVAALLDFTKDLNVGLLIASAGFGSSGPFLDNPIEPELEMLDVNCRSLMELSWHFGNRLSKRGNGGLVLLSSIVSFQGTPWSAHYSATKAYVQTLAEGLAMELRSKNIDVLAVAPGPTKTSFADRAGMSMGSALDPQKIAPEILAALGLRTTVLPGFLSKLLVYSMAPLPRWARIMIMGNVMKSMSKK